MTEGLLEGVGLGNASKLLITEKKGDLDTIHVQDSAEGSDTQPTEVVTSGGQWQRRSSPAAQRF
jgi:hypothetical protein